ncbi:MAG: hypothetical protein J6A59_00320 [Lachnospiraceae bacterium]|nr:hypothetical protein [Lachnospiraceae bacterium]
MKKNKSSLCNLLVTIITAFIAAFSSIAALILVIACISDYRYIGVIEVLITLMVACIAYIFDMHTYKLVERYVVKDDKISTVLKSYIRLYKTSNMFSIVVLILSFLELGGFEAFGLAVPSIVYSIIINRAIRLNIKQFKG